MSHIKDTTPPTRPSKITKANIYFILRFIPTFFGAIKPTAKSPSVAITNFSNGISGIKTTAIAIIAPTDDAKMSRFTVVGILEKQAAKYSDKRSTVKFIKKYTSIYKVRIFTTSFL